MQTLDDLELGPIGDLPVDLGLAVVELSIAVNKAIIRAFEAGYPQRLTSDSVDDAFRDLVTAMLAHEAKRSPHVVRNR